MGSVLINNMGETMVSIIIPAYNAEATIDRCINSVVNQSYGELDIIIVDDGSVDRTLKKCELWKERDKRIRVYHLLNSGVSHARNYGICKAKGEYLAFIDSDDEIEKEYINELFLAIKKNKSDISICGYTDVFKDYKIEHCLSTADFQKLTGNLHYDMFALRRFINSPCMKLYKKEIILRNNIFFPEDMTTAEDQYFNYQYFDNINKVAFINKTGYYYYRENSILSFIKSESCFYDELKNLNSKSVFLYKNNIYNGDYIMAETICYLIRRYAILNDEMLNSYQAVKQRFISLKPYCKDIILDNIKDNILYQLLKRGLFWPIYYYFKLRIRVK